MNLDKKYIKLSPSQRLYELDVPIVGLTGGIATGKSTVSDILLSKRIPLIDADKLVKGIYAEEATKNFIFNLHPEVVTSKRIDFKKLRNIFFTNENSKRQIEQYIYQRIPNAFINQYQALQSPPFIFYDVPLLFEKDLNTKVDVSVLVYAPREIQKLRLISRDDNTPMMADQILKHQIDIEEKKKKADLIIPNTTTKTDLATNVDKLLLTLFS